MSQTDARNLTAAFVVRAPGEIDIVNQGDFRAELEAASVQTTMLIVDLTQTTFCDSSGVAVLHQIRKQLNETGGDLRIASAEPLRRYLVIDLQDQLLAIFASVTEALHLAPRPNSTSSAAREATDAGRQGNAPPASDN